MTQFTDEEVKEYGYVYYGAVDDGELPVTIRRLHFSAKARRPQGFLDASDKQDFIHAGDYITPRLMKVRDITQKHIDAKGGWDHQTHMLKIALRKLQKWDVFVAEIKTQERFAKPPLTADTLI